MLLQQWAKPCWVGLDPANVGIWKVGAQDCRSFMKKQVLWLCPDSGFALGITLLLEKVCIVGWGILSSPVLYQLTEPMSDK